MTEFQLAAVGVAIPFFGTTFGAAMAFFLSGEMSPKLQKALLGFASGVMIAASVWSLLLPAIDMAAERGISAWIPAAAGFLTGVVFLLALDAITAKIHLGTDSPEGAVCRMGRSVMLVLAVTIHNVPEGMAVGVVLAGALSGDGLISAAGALALAAGIGIQNFPEGAIISMPLVSCGMKRPKAFAIGFLSGAVEPVAAILTILLTALITPALPYILSFAAGAMIYVVIEELIPEAQAGEHGSTGTVGAALGFMLMMVLDVALG